MNDELSELSKRQIIIKYKERHPNLSKYAIAKYVKEKTGNTILRAKYIIP